MFRSAPGYKRYLNFYNKEAVSVQNEDNNLAVVTKIIIDDEDIVVPVEETINNNITGYSKIPLQFDILNRRIKIIVPVNSKGIITSNKVELL